MKWAFLASLLICNRGLQAQTVIVGPSVVPAPLLVGDTHILAGTEIIATEITTYSGGTGLFGEAAVVTNWGTDLFVDGGLFKGATVTTLANTQSAAGGPAFAFSNGYNYATFYDGTYLGGSVLVDAATPASAVFGGASAIAVSGNDSIFGFKIYGGRYEGGVVSLAASPEVAVSRAPAIGLWNGYSGPLDVFGGEFVGGIEWRHNAIDLKIHGSDFNVQPAPINGRVQRDIDIVVSGKYDDGTPFSHQLTLNRSVETYIYEMGDYLAVSSINIIPEPTTLPLLSVGGVFIWVFRRR
jgi:hypothetical protein